MSGEKLEDSLLEKVVVNGDSLVLGQDFRLQSLVEKTESVNEFTSSAMSILPELEFPVIGKFSGIFAKLDSMSNNKRFYSADFWRKVLSSDRVNSDLASGKMLGIFEHPNVTSIFTKEGQFTVRHPVNSAFVVKRLWIDGNDIKGEAYLLNTPIGKLLTTFFLAKDSQGVPLFDLFISARGYTKRDYFDENGIDHMNPDDYFLQSFDVVLNPGIQGARVKMESDSEEMDRLNLLTEKVSRVYQETLDIKNELRKELGLVSV